MKKSAYCERAGILPQFIDPVVLAFLNISTSMTVTATIANSTDKTCGTDNPIRTLASTK